MHDISLNNRHDAQAILPHRGPPTLFQLSVCYAGVDLVVDVVPGQHLAIILDVIARDYGATVTELIILRDGHGDVLDHHAPIGHEYPHHRRHHVHHRGPVAVTVHYKEATRHRDFVRQATFEQVLDWAINIFTIDASLAAECELTQEGSTQELTLSDHVGHLARGCDALILNLVRGDIANGGQYD